ncbi:hypothetical protein BDAP_000257 [Binucleata daphniae]
MNIGNRRVMKDRYIKQMLLGCGLSNCKRIFCKNAKDQLLLTDIADKLIPFGDVFLCQKQENLLNYYDFDLTNNKSGFENSDKREELQDENFSAYNHKNCKIDFKDIHSDYFSSHLQFFFELLMIFNGKKNLHCLDHRFCENLKDKLTNENGYILKNIIKILLHLYTKERNLVIGLITLRLFTIFDEFDYLDNKDYVTICDMFVEVHHQASHNLYETSNKYNFERECLKTPDFTLKDYVHFVESFTKLLNDYPNPFVRSDSIFEDLLNTYTVMYLINEKLQIFPYKKFYLEDVCKKQIFKEEFRFYKADCKSILHFNFILPLEIKAEFLKYENSDTMKTTLQDAFFRSLFVGPISPYLFVTVNRNSVYQDTFELLKKINGKDLLKQIKITFKNEEGIDSVGIRKEFFQLISEEIQEDEALFVTKNNILWLKNNESRLLDYEIIGKLIAIALYNDVILNIPFPSLFFKKILDKEIHFLDISEIEPEIFCTLSNIKKMKNDEIKNMGLTFQINFENENINLIDNADKVEINEGNLCDFIDLYKDFISTKSIYKPFESIKKGFYSIINRDLISFLQPKELEKIIAGTPCIDVQMLKKSCILNGYDYNEKYITDFWDIVENYSTEEKKKFLQFITGNDRIPVGGLDNLKLVIMRNGCDTNRLPSSQTCFNTLLLPEYSSKEKMEEKMGKAISMTKGFFLL